MITVLMDYDGTLHDHDAVITHSIHGILGQPDYQIEQGFYCPSEIGERGSQ